MPGEGDVLVCEGAEDGLSLWFATRQPVRIAFGVSNLGTVPLPDGTTVVIVADNDKRGIDGAHEAADKLIKRGHAPKIAVPPDGVKDANDMLVKQGMGAVRAMVAKAAAISGRGEKPNVPTYGEGPIGWLEPRPIPEVLLPVEPFDTRTLPRSIAPWVADIAERMQCPLDFVAIPALVALGSLIGRRVAIRPQRKTDWQEVANLWACIVGRPGTMKSPAMHEVLKPLNGLEPLALKDGDAARKDYERELELYKIRRDEAGKLARSALKKGNAVPDIDVAEPEEPQALRYKVNDTSVEALGVILASNPNGALVDRDELVSLLQTLDREEFASARGFYLSAWNGNGGYTFDRIIRGRTHIEAACISMLGSTQPGRIAEYIRRTTTGGAGDDRLIQRFGLLVWPDGSPDWKEVDRYGDSEAREAAWGTFKRLASLDPATIGACQDEYEPVPFLRFNDAAQDTFREWRADLEKRLRGDDMSAALTSHLAKYKKLVPALALIGHVADGGTDAVDEAATLRALALSEYLESHARRAYGAGSDIEASAAKAILARIRKRYLTDGFTARDVHQRDWSSLTDKSHVKAGLELLWILYRRNAALPDSAPLTYKDWRSVSFVRSTKAILLRCMREKGCKPSHRAQPLMRPVPRPVCR